MWRRLSLPDPKRIAAVVFSPPNKRFSLLVIAAVVILLGVLAAVVTLELIAARPGHVENNCGSISRVLGFGGTVFSLIALGLRQEYLSKRHEQRTVDRTDKLRTDVRDDVKDAVQPVVTAAEEAVRKAEELARKAEHRREIKEAVAEALAEREKQRGAGGDAASSG
jgi:hypothetical protein